MKIISLLTIILITTNCSQKIVSSKQNTRQRLIMGTLVSVQLPKNKTEAFEAVFSQFSDIDQKLSTYKKNSEISKLNDGQEVQLSDLSLSAFKSSIDLYHLTNGYFNIFTGKKTLAAKKNIKHLSLKPMKPNFQTNYNLNGNLLKLNNNSKIDLGGMAKGLAVDQTLTWLNNNNIQRAQVSASGDIGCLGPCKLYIQNPITESPLMSFTNSSTRLAISTSGNYRKKTLSHIINPKTGRFVNHWLSVTLLAKNNNTQLDAFTTAVFSMPKAEAMTFLKTQNIQYVLIDHNKTVYTSGSLESLVSEIKWLNTKDLKIK